MAAVAAAAAADNLQAQILTVTTSWSSSSSANAVESVSTATPGLTLQLLHAQPACLHNKNGNHKRLDVDIPMWHTHQGLADDSEWHEIALPDVKPVGCTGERARTPAQLLQDQPGPSQPDWMAHKDQPHAHSQ
jgi:hypothetical protein